MMKIELKREDPVGAAKEDKSKEAIRDQVTMDEQALPVMRNRKISLNPTMLILPPLRLQPSVSLIRFIYKISISIVKLFCIWSTLLLCGESFEDWSAC